MRIVFVTIFLLFNTLSGFSQEIITFQSRRQPYLQINFHTGSFWSRSIYLEEQFSDPYKAVEARFGYQLTGTRLWQQYHRYPKYGMGIHYSDLVRDRTDTIVGNPFSFFGFYSSPWARFGPFTLASDFSVGLSYTGKIYDPVINPFNDVIASHINLYFDFDLNLQVNVTQHMGLTTGYGLTHYSNGRIQMPQKGVNNWGWTFGVQYKPNGSEPEFIRREPPPFKSKEWIELMYAVGVVEGIVYRSTQELRFFTSSFTADYVCTLNPRMGVAFGLDVLYDGSLKRAIAGIPPDEVTTWQQMYLASHLGPRFFIDRLMILFDLSTYFSQRSYDRGYYFARVGGRWQFTDHLYGHLCIKTKNGIRSDWIEWGAAYQFDIGNKRDIKQLDPSVDL